MNKAHVISIALILTAALVLCACQGTHRDQSPNYKPYQTYDNNQNLAKGSVITDPYEVGGKRYSPMTVAEAAHYCESGEAVWYGAEMDMNENGNYRTANGEVFDDNLMTAGHKFLPLPTYVKVTNVNNNRSVIVRVNDRGPFNSDCLIVLSKAAAEQLGFERTGTAPVIVETVQVGGNSYMPR